MKIASEPKVKAMLKAYAKVLSIVLMSSTASLAFAGSKPHMPDLLPSNPAAGECYARVAVPAKFQTRTQRVLVESAHAEFQVTEPKLRARQEQVLIKEASVRYNVRQPTYRTVTDQVMVRPSYERLQVTRPQFKTVTETIKTSKPRLVWKKGNPATLRAQGYIIHSTADAGRGGRGYKSTSEYGRAQSSAVLCGSSCEVWCLVEAPGQSASYNRKVMTAPARIERVVVPPKYSSITKTVVADRGGVEEIPIPAEYRPITVEDVVRPASVRQVKVPNKYANIDKKKLISPERYEWRRVVCKLGTRPPVTKPLPATSYRSPEPVQIQRGVSAHAYRHATSPQHIQTYKKPSTHPSHQASRLYRYEGRPAASPHHTNTAHTNTGQISNHVTPNETRVLQQTSYGTALELRGRQAYQEQSTENTGKSYYYGTDLPTYSEDYTQPSRR